MGVANEIEHCEVPGLPVRVARMFIYKHFFLKYLFKPAPPTVYAFSVGGFLCYYLHVKVLKCVTKYTFCINKV